MRVINLSVSNVKKITAAEITPDKNTVILSGKNEAGKSTVLDSMFMALTGKVSEDPIQHGKEKAEICVDLGDYIVTKTLTEKGAYLKVTNRDGVKFNSPQKTIDEFMGDIGFDPLKFANMKEKEQHRFLMKLAGVNFDETKKLIDKYYTERTIAGREVKNLKGRLSVFENKDFSGVPDEEVSISELNKKLQEENRKREEKNSQERHLKGNQLSINDNLEAIQRKQEEIQKLNTEIRILQDQNSKLKSENFDIEDSLSQIVFDDSILDQVNNAEQVNQSVREKKEYQSVKDQLSDKEFEYNSYTEQIKEAEESNFSELSKLQEAGLPFEVKIDMDKALFDGMAFSELSSAAKLKVSLVLAMEANPKLKVIHIKDGSLLDSRSLQIITDLAEAKDYQIWIERVCDSEDNSEGIYIEEGEILSGSELEVKEENKGDLSQGALFEAI